MAITIETFLRPLARDLRDRGWSVDAAAAGLTGSLEPFAETHDLDLTRRPTALRHHGRAVRDLRRLVRRGRYDLVHLHTPIAAALARVAVRSLPRRERPTVVYTAHGFHFYEGAPRSAHVYEALERTLASSTDAVLTINREDEERARRIFACPVHRLPSVGLDLDHYSAERIEPAAVDRFREEHRLEGSFAVLVVAALDPGKRHERLLRALAQWEHPVVVLLAGAGPEQERLEALAADLGMRPCVRFLGMVDDVRVSLVAADCLVLPSEREGLPRSILEAMAMGTPVIASDIRGARDLLDDGAGLLVDAADPAALREAVDRLARDGDLRDDLVARAHRRVQEHALDRVPAVHGEVIDGLDPRRRR